MAEKTHWKKLTNPNYMGDYSIPPGRDLIAVIDHVAQEKVVGVGGKSDMEMVAHFSDGNKPLILNKTNMKIIQKIYQTPYIEDWAGLAIQIYYDPTVKFGRETVGGIRIRPFKPEQPKAVHKCADCGKEIAASNGKTADWVAAYTHQKYGRELCADCAAKLKVKLDEQKTVEALEDREEK